MNQNRNLKEIQESLYSGDLKLVDLVNHYLKNIKKKSSLNVFISIFEEEALQQAKEIQNRLNNKSAGKLAGLIISIKDVISIKDKLHTCGSKILSNFYALYNATVVQRLMDEDAVIIGKVNCDEFAMGSSNENSYFGPVRNPYDESRVPGGSSGGSAVSVAADMCLVSLGSETGGSIRQPASFCGITGLKATYGRISRFGLTAFASSCDSIGVFAKDNYDIAAVLDVIAGTKSGPYKNVEEDLNRRDSTLSLEDKDDYIKELSKEFKPGEVKFGFVKEYFGEGLDEGIKQTILAKIEHLRKKGFEVKEVSLPHSKYVIQTYYILTCAEASSNLARYDGVRYGYRTEKFSNLEEMYVNTRAEGFGAEVKRRIMLGTYVLSSGYYDAYYRKGQKMRRLITEDFDNAFNEVDFILSPTTPTTAFKIGEKTDDPLSMYLNDIYTASVNLASIPAISIPVGTDSNGLPFGLQIMGKKFDEAGLLRAAELFNN